MYTITKNLLPSTVILFNFLLTISSICIAQQPGDTTIICRQTIPAGWVCTRVGAHCDSASIFGLENYKRTIKYYLGYAPGTELEISADTRPTGWVKTDLRYGPAIPAIINGQLGTSIYDDYTIKKIDGLETADSITTVDEPTPDGWIAIELGPFPRGNTIFETNRIIRIDKMDPNRSYLMAATVPPKGWVITAITTRAIANSIYEVYFITNYYNMPLGSSITSIDNGLYSPVQPDGWVTNVTGHIQSTGPPIYNTYTMTKVQNRISGNVNGVWTKNGSPYVLTGTVTIPVGQTLKIEPGVKVIFTKPSVDMIVNGKLDARGTVIDSIRFQGTAYSPTELRGGNININNSGSILKYVSIDSLGQSGYNNGAVYIPDGITPSITNATIRNSATSDVYTWIGGTKNFSDINGVIAIPGGSISRDETILKVGNNSSYKLLSNLTIPLGKKLTIKPGVRLLFSFSTVGITANGILDAQGTYSDSIYFNGTSTSSSYMRGGSIILNTDSSVLRYINIDSLGDPSYNSGSVYIPNGITPIITNTTISHSGTQDIYSWIGGAKNFSEINGIISIPGGSVTNDAVVPKIGGNSYYKLLSNLTIPISKKVTIQPGVQIMFTFSTVGITVNGKLDAQGTVSDSIYFKGTSISSSYPRGGSIILNADSTVLKYVSIDNLGDPSYNSGSVYISNGITPTIGNSTIRHSGTADVYTWVGGAKNFSEINGVISISGGNVTNDAVMPKVGGNSYFKLLSNLTIPMGKKVTIQPGVQLMFTFSTVGITVNGKLDAQGIATDSIYFKGTSISSSYPRGGSIILNTDSSMLKYVSIDSLGDPSYNSGSVYIPNGIIPIITNTTISHSGTQDIYSWIGGAKNFSEINGIISIPGGSVTNDAVVPKIGGNSYYKLLSNLTIPISKKVTIQPGVQIMFTFSTVGITVNGKLDAQGTVSDSIYFKGTSISSSYPRGGSIILNTDSSVLRYINIDSLGDPSYNSGSVYISAMSSISNSTIKNSGTSGLYVTSSGAKITYCNISHNASGITVASGKPLIFYCNIYDNTNFGVNNYSTTDTVDATYCYWGAASGPYHVTFNPMGMGNKVSDRVLFMPLKPENTICPECSITFSFVSPGDGYSFRWQVDSGNGFANISNGGVFIAATTNTLQLLTPPTSWYGYKFRCIATRESIIINGLTQTLRFSNVFLGTVNTAWENPVNWSCQTLPDNNTDVIIYSGSLNTVMLNTNGECRSLTLSKGTTIRVSSSYNLQVKGK